MPLNLNTFNFCHSYRQPMQVENPYMQLAVTHRGINKMTANRSLEYASGPVMAVGESADVGQQVLGHLDSISAIPETERRLASNIQTLPSELLSHIFGYLDSPKPSDSPLNDEPTFDLTRSETADLKTISCISKRWRTIIIPNLFRHAQFIVTDSKSNRPILNIQIEPFYDFIKQYDLQRVVTSFTLLVHDKKVVNTTVGEYRLFGFSSFWSALFEIINPIELLIIAPPAALGLLTACRVFSGDAWNFDCPCHYFRLQRAATSPFDSSSILNGVSAHEYPTNGQTREITEPFINNSSVDNISLTRNSTARATDNLDEAASIDLNQIIVDPWEYHRAQTSAVFDIRPWTNLLLNEGSFIRAYKTYEFWLRHPPSILSDLVGGLDESHTTFISPTIREMSYIGIFPMERHFRALSNNLPRLDKLYVQLVPRNNILNNPQKMAQVEPDDLWMERNSCYASVIQELFTTPPRHNYKHIKVFESGDAADVDAWLMAVECVKRFGSGWKIAGDGVFVREPTPVLDDAEASGKPASIFEGSLIRWAWNGTARLPVSAVPIYEQAHWLVN